MKPCTIEQLYDALEQEDGVGSYEIKMTLDLQRIDLDPEKVDVVKAHINYKTCIDITYPESYVGLSDGPLTYAELVSLFITPTGVKFRHGKRNIARFKNYKDVEHLAAKLIVKIRKQFGIEMVF